MVPSIVKIGEPGPHLEIDMVHFWYRKTFSGHEQVMLCTKNVSKGGQGGRGREMSSNPSLPETSFSTQNAKNRLAAGTRPDPLRELKRSPRSPIRSGAREGKIL